MTGDYVEQVGVVCGACGGPLYMETCQQNGGPSGCEWVVASECQSCGGRFPVPCAEGHQ